MDTKILRKIILQELRKVLKEEDYAGYDPDKDQTDYAEDPQSEKEVVKEIQKFVNKLVEYAPDQTQKRGCVVDGKVGKELMTRLTYLANWNSKNTPEFPKLKNLLPQLKLYPKSNEPKILFSIHSLLQSAAKRGAPAGSMMP